MVPNVRYMLDFKVLPKLIHKNANAFIKNCLKHQEDYIAQLFNNHYFIVCGEESIQYDPKDFKVSNNKMSKNISVLYIELPQECTDSDIYCVAYAIAYTTSAFGIISNARYYTVEKSAFDTDCIGSMSVDGQHFNFCNAFAAPTDNINAVYNLYQ